MCGLVGFFEEGRSSRERQSIVERMSEQIAYRGPDDQASWVDSEGISLAHQRLSIIDLSSSGRQPMVSASGRYILVYNGEIYNFKKIKEELDQKSYPFKGRSDSEVLLAAIDTWGLNEALTRVTGMFAIALWDQRERQLSLVRDRMGEKPLYYGWNEGVFFFASELKALEAHPKWRGVVDREALSLYLRYSYVPSPYSIYEGIYKLLPGHVLTMDLPFPEDEVAPEAYWNLREFRHSPQTLSDTEVVDKSESLLKEILRDQIISDVPLGAFLSGGVDSSLVVSLMQSMSSQKIETFTIGFDDPRYDESIFARNIAEHLGTKHNELIMNSAQLIDLLPEIANIYDEPFADSSQLPTILLSRFARKSVTVSLSGDGGDELFCGYTRYLWVRSIWDRIQSIPLPLRKKMSEGIQGVPEALWQKTYSIFDGLMPKFIRQAHFGTKMYKISQVLGAKSPLDIYERLISQWPQPNLVRGMSGWPKNSYWQSLRKRDFSSIEEQMMYIDSFTYLSDDIMAKVDRASMNVGLEVRTPFLDRRIFEFVWGLPIEQRISQARSKWILREILKKYVPAQLMDRPKQGFSAPIGEWLRKDLREWGEELLSENRLKQEGYFEVKGVRKLWADHLSGKSNNDNQLWNLLMFQAWQPASR